MGESCLHCFAMVKLTVVVQVVMVEQMKKTMMGIDSDSNTNTVLPQMIFLLLT